MCVCVCVWEKEGVCVWERDRERQKNRERESELGYRTYAFYPRTKREGFLKISKKKSNTTISTILDTSTLYFLFNVFLELYFLIYAIPNEFESHRVPQSYGFVPHLSKKLSKLPPYGI